MRNIREVVSSGVALVKKACHESNRQVNRFVLARLDASCPVRIYDLLILLNTHPAQDLKRSYCRETILNLQLSFI